jgi:hypothetical protein
MAMRMPFTVLCDCWLELPVRGKLDTMRIVSCAPTAMDERTSMTTNSGINGLVVIK